MKTNRSWIYPIAIIGFLLILSNVEGNSIYSDLTRNYYSHQPVSLFGPRMGVTVIAGETAEKLKNDYDAVPIITQFGWQFEWRFFSIEDGPTGVVEIIPLIGGLEQGLFIPSLSIPMGIRSKTGFEIGIGPNISISGFSIVIAVGQTFQAGQLYLPLNFAFVPSKEGARFSLIFGFNTAR